MEEKNPHLVPCDCGEEAEDEKPPFCGDKKYVSDEERAVLAVMRQIRQESLSVRAELKRLDHDQPSDEKQELQARLEQLRRRFKEQQAALARATEEKMRRLGHIP